MSGKLRVLTDGTDGGCGVQTLPQDGIGVCAVPGAVPFQQAPDEVWVPAPEDRQTLFFQNETGRLAKQAGVFGTAPDGPVVSFLPVGTLPDEITLLEGVDGNEVVRRLAPEYIEDPSEENLRLVFGRLMAFQISPGQLRERISVNEASLDAARIELLTTGDGLFIQAGERAGRENPILKPFVEALETGIMDLIEEARKHDSGLRGMQRAWAHVFMGDNGSAMTDLEEGLREIDRLPEKGDARVILVRARILHRLIDLQTRAGADCQPLLDQAEEAASQLDVSFPEEAALLRAETLDLRYQSARGKAETLLDAGGISREASIASLLPLEKELEEFSEDALCRPEIAAHDARAILLEKVFRIRFSGLERKLDEALRLHGREEDGQAGDVFEQARRDFFDGAAAISGTPESGAIDEWLARGEYLVASYQFRSAALKDETALLSALETLRGIASRHPDTSTALLLARQGNWPREYGLVDESGEFASADGSGDLMAVVKAAAGKLATQPGRGLEACTLGALTFALGSMAFGDLPGGAIVGAGCATAYIADRLRVMGESGRELEIAYRMGMSNVSDAEAARSAALFGANLVAMYFGGVAGGVSQKIARATEAAVANRLMIPFLEGLGISTGPWMRPYLMGAIEESAIAANAYAFHTAVEAFHEKVLGISPEGNQGLALFRSWLLIRMLVGVAQLNPAGGLIAGEGIVDQSVRTALNMGVGAAGFELAWGGLTGDLRGYTDKTARSIWDFGAIHFGNMGLGRACNVFGRFLRLPSLPLALDEVTLRNVSELHEKLEEGPNDRGGFGGFGPELAFAGPSGSTMPFRPDFNRPDIFDGRFFMAQSSGRGDPPPRGGAPFREPSPRDEDAAGDRFEGLLKIFSDRRDATKQLARILANMDASDADVRRLDDLERQARDLSSLLPKTPALARFTEGRLTPRTAAEADMRKRLDRALRALQARHHPDRGGADEKEFRNGMSTAFGRLRESLKDGRGKRGAPVNAVAPGHWLLNGSQPVMVGSQARHISLTGAGIRELHLIITKDGDRWQAITHRGSFCRLHAGGVVSYVDDGRPSTLPTSAILGLGDRVELHFEVNPDGTATLMTEEARRRAAGRAGRPGRPPEPPAAAARRITYAMRPGSADGEFYGRGPDFHFVGQSRAGSITISAGESESFDVPFGKTGDVVGLPKCQGDYHFKLSYVRGVWLISSTVPNSVEIFASADVSLRIDAAPIPLRGVSLIKVNRQKYRVKVDDSGKNFTLTLDTEPAAGAPGTGRGDGRRGEAQRGSTGTYRYETIDGTVTIRASGDSARATLGTSPDADIKVGSAAALILRLTYGSGLWYLEPVIGSVELGEGASFMEAPLHGALWNGAEVRLNGVVYNVSIDGSSISLKRKGTGDAQPEDDSAYKVFSKSAADAGRRIHHFHSMRFISTGGGWQVNAREGTAASLKKASGAVIELRQGVITDIGDGDMLQFGNRQYVCRFRGDSLEVRAIRSAR